jgi:hypothetical protein
VSEEPFSVGDLVETRQGPVRRHRGVVTVVEDGAITIQHDTKCPLCDHEKGERRYSELTEERALVVWRVIPGTEKTYLDRMLAALDD